MGSKLLFHCLPRISFPHTSQEGVKHKTLNSAAHFNVNRAQFVDAIFDKKFETDVGGGGGAEENNCGIPSFLISGSAARLEEKTTTRRDSSRENFSHE